MKSNRLAAPDAAASRPPRVIILLSLLPLTFATLLVLQGCDAITTRHFEMPWNSRTSVGFGFFGVSVKESHGVAIYDGHDAIRMGIGLISAALMLFVWVIALVWHFIRPKVDDELSPPGKVLAWLSFLALLTFLNCIFPPWRTSSFLFLPVAILPAALVFFVPREITQKRAAGIFAGLIFTAILLEQFYAGRGFDIIVGIFAGMLILLHLVMVFPHLRKRALPDE